MQHPFVDESRIESGADRLRKRIDSLALHFLVDVGGQQPRGKLRIRGVIDHERRGRADGQFIQLARGGAVVETCDGLERDAHGIDVWDPLAAARYGAHDLVDVDGFMRAGSLGHAHGMARRRRRVQIEFWLQAERGRLARQRCRVFSRMEIHGDVPSE